MNDIGVIGMLGEFQSSAGPLDFSASSFNLTRW